MQVTPSPMMPRFGQTAKPRFGAENEKLAQKPEDLVMKLPNGRYMVNQNPHIGSEDTLIPGQSCSSFEEALGHAKEWFKALKESLPHLPWPKDEAGKEAPLELEAPADRDENPFL